MAIDRILQHKRPNLADKDRIRRDKIRRSFVKIAERFAEDSSITRRRPEPSDWIYVAQAASESKCGRWSLFAKVLIRISFIQNEDDVWRLAADVQSGAVMGAPPMPESPDETVGTECMAHHCPSCKWPMTQVASLGWVCWHGGHFFCKKCQQLLHDGRLIDGSLRFSCYECHLWVAARAKGVSRFKSLCHLTDELFLHTWVGDDSMLKWIAELNFSEVVHPVKHQLPRKADYRKSGPYQLIPMWERKCPSCGHMNDGIHQFGRSECDFCHAVWEIQPFTLREIVRSPWFWLALVAAIAVSILVVLRVA